MRSLLFLAAIAAPTVAQDAPFRDGHRVVFLGDSNTFAGRFIAYLDYTLITRYPDRKVELLNLGLPSETVSGLSEPDHPYPRPNVHDRLAAVLAKTKPNVVVACYGMNDGIYYPFSEDRFKGYQEGYRKLIADCEKAGARVILMTPSPFDARPLKDKVLPAGAAKYSWMRPYEKYDDEVLSRYAEWLVTLRDKGYVVADPHTAVLKHLATARKADPNYRVAGDGIHPDANGHYVVYKELATALKIPVASVSESVDFATGKASGALSEVNAKDRSFTWTGVATMPLDGAWTKPCRAIEKAGVMTLKVAGLDEANHTLMDAGRKVGTNSSGEWEAGTDIGSWPEHKLSKRAAELWTVVEEKNRILGLAWLTDVGHKRPDTPKGLPLAEAERKAKDLDARARELAKPVEMKLRLVKSP